MMSEEDSLWLSQGKGKRMEVRRRQLADWLRLRIVRLLVGKHKPQANDHNQRAPRRDQPTGLRFLLLLSHTDSFTFLLFAHRICSPIHVVMSMAPITIINELGRRCTTPRSLRNRKLQMTVISVLNLKSVVTYPTKPRLSDV